MLILLTNHLLLRVFPAAAQTSVSHDDLLALFKSNRNVPLVIVGAHYDSTAGSATARAPGADDNGSGTINCLEALRILANADFKPKNTLEFHFYGGEEGGLLGSQGVFNSYRSSGETVLAFLNQDMTGYSPGGKATVYTDYVDSSLTSYVILVARQYSGLAVSTSTCGYGCSDHASARAAGFRKRSFACW